MENNQTTRTMAMEDLHLIRQVLDQTATSFQTLAPVFWRMGLVWLLYGVLAFFVNTSDFIGYYFPPLALPQGGAGGLSAGAVCAVAEEKRGLCGSERAAAGDLAAVLGAVPSAVWRGRGGASFCTQPGHGDGCL